MEVPGARENKCLVLVSEAIGCGMLVVTVNFTNGQPYQWMAVGLTLALAISLLGPISNAHCNPAVTLGVLIREIAEGTDFCPNFAFALGIMLA